MADALGMVFFHHTEFVDVAVEHTPRDVWQVVERMMRDNAADAGITLGAAPLTRDVAVAPGSTGPMVRHRYTATWLGSCSLEVSQREPGPLIVWVRRG